MARRKLSAGRARARRRPLVESLEGRTLMAVVYNEFALPSQYSAINQMIPGPDRNIWFTEYQAIFRSTTIGIFDGAIGTFNPSTHATAEYSIGNRSSEPQGITVGPDGNLWFADSGLGVIGTINLSSHAIVEYPTGRAGSKPFGIASGPDGKLWFTEPTLGSIGSIDPTTHAVVEYPTHKSTDDPRGIVSGPGGDLWFTENLAIGAIDPLTHAIVEYPVSNGTVESGLTVGSDGNIWFTAYEFPMDFRIRRDFGEIDATTHAITLTAIYDAEYVHPGILDTTNGITVGPDGNIWSGVAEINPTTHVVIQHEIISDNMIHSNLHVIAKGADNNLYYAGTSYNYNGTGTIGQARLLPQTEAVIEAHLALDPTLDGTFFGGPAEGRTVYLDLNGDGTLDPGDPSGVTSSLGNYLFTGLNPGTYTLRVRTAPGDFVLAGATTVTASGGQLTSPPTIGLVTTSAVLPIVPSLNPFGTRNPDVSTAEVNGLYRIILNRAPDAGGGANAVAYLKNGGSLRALASSLFHSVEYDAIVVQADFHDYLGRSGSASDIASGVAALQRGVTPEALASFFLATPEYNRLHTANSDFATAVYEDTLGRALSASELARVTAALDAGLNRQTLTSSLVASPEADNRAVNGFYSTFLARTGDTPGINFWVAGLQNGVSLIDEAIEFASSAQFIARANGTVV